MQEKTAFFASMTEKQEKIPFGLSFTLSKNVAFTVRKEIPHGAGSKKTDVSSFIKSKYIIFLSFHIQSDKRFKIYVTGQPSNLK